MNIDQLKYFADLAKTNSISATAKRMFISQQSVSESLKRLENELGCTLVIRSRNGVAFTDDGKQILEYAQNILEQHHKMEQYAASRTRQNQPGGNLTIGVGPTVGKTFLPALMTQMHQQYPLVQLHILEHSGEIIPSLLQKHTIDFGIIGIYSNPDETQFIVPAHRQLSSPELFRSLQRTELYRDSIVCVMAKNHPLSASETLDIKQLETIPQTNYGTDITLLTSMHAVHVSTNARIHQQFLLEDGLVCCMPYQTFLTEFSDKNFICRPVTDTAPVVYYLVYRKEIAAETKNLYSCLIETAQNIDYKTITQKRGL